MRVERTFAFVDLCGFTRFTDTHGDEEAVDVPFTVVKNEPRTPGSMVWTLAT